jgi:hypothetical protein
VSASFTSSRLSSTAPLSDSFSTSSMRPQCAAQCSAVFPNCSEEGKWEMAAQTGTCHPPAGVRAVYLVLLFYADVLLQQKHGYLRVALAAGAEQRRPTVLQQHSRHTGSSSNSDTDTPLRTR